jgi:hypothetical protein
VVSSVVPLILKNFPSQKVAKKNEMKREREAEWGDTGFSFSESPVLNG